MKVITELNTGVILDIADDVENTEEGTKVTKNGEIYYFGFEVDIHDVEGVPSNVAPSTHIYDGTIFAENPNYVAPYNAETEIADLKNQLTMLQLALAELAGIIAGGE